MKNEKQKPKKQKQVHMARRILGDLAILLAVLLTVDVIFVMTGRIRSYVESKDVQEVLVYDLILCAVLLICAVDLRFGIFSWFKNRATRILGWIVRSIFLLGAAVTLFFCGRVLCTGLINTAAPARYVIVLGMSLENGNPSKDLLYRLETARDYLGENKDAVLILTGGNAGENGMTEAAVMKDLLVRDGVKEESMLLEDRATDTVENFKNTAAMIDPEEPVVLVTSNFHMQRAVENAEEAGFSHVMRLPARSEFSKIGANMLWEVVMELNRLTLNK